MRKKLQSLPIDAVSARLRSFHFRLLNYGLLHYDSNKKLQDSFLSHYRICVVISGEFRIATSNCSYSLNPGDLFFLAPNVLYSAFSYQPVNCFLYLDFTVDEEADFVELLRLRDVIHLSKLIDQRQQSNLIHLDQTVKNHYPGTYLMVECMLIRILIVMLNRLQEEPTFLVHHAQNAKEKLLAACTDYIENHLTEPITVRQIAAHFNYSENYIYKIFQETLHLSCRDYILEYRLNQALQDLKSSALSISEIAARNGFSSVYHFSGSFKKKFGVSPTYFRGRSFQSVKKRIPEN